jgi:hypothetical protein
MMYLVFLLVLILACILTAVATAFWLLRRLTKMSLREKLSLCFNSPMEAADSILSNASSEMRSTVDPGYSRPSSAQWPPPPR